MRNGRGRPRSSCARCAWVLSAGGGAKGSVDMGGEGHAAGEVPGLLEKGPLGKGLLGKGACGCCGASGHGPACGSRPPKRPVSSAWVG